MDSYPLFLDSLLYMQTLDISQPYDALGDSPPADYPFVDRTHSLMPLSPIEAKFTEQPYPQQPWWKADSLSYTLDSLSSEVHSRGDCLSSWAIGASSPPDLESPDSSNSDSVPFINYHTSPQFQHHTSVGFYTDPSIHSVPEDLTNIDPPLFLPCGRAFPLQPGHQSPFENLASVPSSDSEGKAAPDKRQPRANSVSRGRKSTEKCTGSTPARRRRRIICGKSNEPRTFVCSFAPYGCESIFVSKNEWKRHVTSQHLLLGFYRCDVGKCNSPSQTPQIPGCQSSNSTLAPISSSPNDFNRKDLFTQHQRRMHAPWRQTEHRYTPTEHERTVFDSSLEEVRRRCWHGLRQPPTQSRCGFCGEIFSGDNSWDARMEHVGRHVEREEPVSLGQEIEDGALREWGLNEGILVVVDGRCMLASLIGY